MQLLIDTHIFLWLMEGNERLSESAKKLFIDAENEIFLSVASAWEITIKTALKRLRLPLPVDEYLHSRLRKHRIQLLPIKLQHLGTLESLPYYHRDPFDRLIIAQSIHENLPVISTDHTFDHYSVHRIF